MAWYRGSELLRHKRLNKKKKSDPPVSHEESDVHPVAHERAVFQKSNQGSPNDDEKLCKGRKGEAELGMGAGLLADGHYHPLQKWEAGYMVRRPTGMN